MKFLSHLSLRTRLIIACFIPLLVLFYYLINNLHAENVKKNASQQVISAVSEIDAITKLLHELQKERSLTLALVSNRDTQDETGLLRQYELTDQAVISLNQLWNQEGSAVHHPFADSLQFIRAKTTDLRARREVDEFYISFKSSLLDQVSQLLRASNALNLKNRFEEHLFLLYAKDYLASIRSVLGEAFTIGKFEGTSYGQFASLKGLHEMSLQRFRKIASPELEEFMNKRYNGPFVSRTYSFIDSAFNHPTSTASQVVFNDWWKEATGSINALKEAEDYSAMLIGQKAEEELAAAYAYLRFNIILAVLTVGILIVLVIATIRGIVNSINKIRFAAEKMAKGEIDMVVDVTTRDEIGALATSFNQMIAETRNFSDIANSIGKGNYDVEVKVRGEDDVLGVALNTMRANLSQLSIDNELRTWLLKGSSELNDRIRGEKDIRTLAQDAIIQIVPYLGAQLGAVYLNENDRLVLIGSYAFHNRKGNLNHFAVGEGLVGQAALEKKPILFTEIPPDYVRIQSGLGDAVPKSIIVFPLLYEGRVKGVIEMGSAHEFREVDMQLLDIVGENLAIAFHGAQSRARVKDLLEETQRQAEELETQQEELKQSNDELHEKTRLLERSEAELKAQQEELQQTNEELEEKASLLEEQKERLENSKIDIENKARELEVTGKYKSEFLANMSHELRTPLNSILILSQLLSENKSKLLGAKEIEFATNIYNSGTDLLNLINEILDLSKVESGRMELEVGEVNYKDIERDMSAMFSEVARNKSIEFIIDNRLGDSSFLATDRQRLGQILRNLLSNAFKFTSKGGRVEFIIDKVQEPVPGGKNLYSGTDIVSFTVSDNGIGIPDDKQDIIFEAFQQADGSTKRKFGGTGLGLSISRELANALGGEIHLESEMGSGSTFTLWLPANFNANADHKSVHRAQDRRTTIKPARPDKIVSIPVGDLPIDDDRDSTSENDKLVLIMEDDLAFAQMLVDFVRDRNYKGIVATQGNTGLSYARHFRPDAIILDMKLPVMDGAEVLRHLKIDPELRHIPVQIISGYDTKKVSLELGAFNFIRKPVNKDQLTSSFENIEAFMNKKLKKLLVVEDNENQNKAIRELIGNGDVKSFAAYSGKEGYSMMTTERYDCVIVDLGLPDMSGFELLEKIKSDDRLNKVPIVVYTGRDLSKDENTRLLKFANTVVLKTADSQERLLDETMLFLHRVESKLPKEKQTIIRNLHKTSEVLDGKKVLVVDDDIRNIYSITNVLEDEGMNCMTAENGKVAVKMLKEHPEIDIVLMDVMMPEMDGFDATREIRNISKFSKLPIIALTAKAMKGDREKCLNSGMSDYIAKPVNIERLLSLMRVWLYK